MRCCIISIGDELVRGLTINTSAPMISSALLEQGYSVNKVIAVGDEKRAIKQEIKQAMQTHDLLILTGGLGPTSDDLTRQVLSELFNRPLKHSKQVAQDLEKRYGPQLSTLEDQSIILEGTKIYLNPVGTAPGFSFQEKESMVMALPGPPSQMQTIFLQMLKDIVKKFPAQGVIEKRYLFGLSEEQIDPFIREWEPQVEGLSIGVCPSYGVVSVYFWQEMEARSESFSKVLCAFDKLYAKQIYSTFSPDLEKAVIELLKEKKKKLTLAESCSGGLGLTRLTDVAGASDVILGGWVSYSNIAKQQWLGVDSKLLQSLGAVSIEVAEAMAQGALERLPVDYAISITGIAGPSGGSLNKPVGTVCVALAMREEGKVFSTQFLSKGSGLRSLVKTYSVNFVLSAFFAYLKWGQEPFSKGRET
ncbi:hypothetical protein COB21_04160 [Candidatus Aerophobetes bacterium]|uniref:CinA-like protein n=1 Tax=Aerophobetes bacterium TaxID=2030807 RepID=A0A2A4X1W2_UNCAE|nr:MAG: hypothetical protein COB21_04160 [Candidatus Aerophobetes bacterium]